MTAFRTASSLLLALGFAAGAQAQSLKVMTYNVENLFDTIDNPSTNDEEFTPNGAQAWTQAVLTDKMRNLGEVIRQENPDVLGLQEVENAQILNEFVRTGLAGQGYRYVVAAETRDNRGIRPAFVSKYPIVESRSVPVDNSKWIEHGTKKAGRDILVVTIDTGLQGDARYVTFLVNHWLSKGGGAIRDGWRQQEARTMAGLVAGIVRQNPGRLVVAMGDFNDELNSRPLTKGLPLTHSLQNFLSAPSGSLFALDSQLAGLPSAQTGTHYFFPDHEWNTLDHMFIAYGDKLRTGSARSFQYVDKSVHVVHSRFVQPGGQPEGCELLKWEQDRPNVRTSCPNGASDHFPMAATFQVR